MQGFYNIIRLQVGQYLIILHAYEKESRYLKVPSRYCCATERKSRPKESVPGSGARSSQLQDENASDKLLNWLANLLLHGQRKI